MAQLLAMSALWEFFLHVFSAAHAPALKPLSRHPISCQTPVGNGGEVLPWCSRGTRAAWTLGVPLVSARGRPRGNEPVRVARPGVGLRTLRRRMAADDRELREAGRRRRADLVCGECRRAGLRAWARGVLVQVRSALEVRVILGAS